MIRKISNINRPDPGSAIKNYGCIFAKEGILWVEDYGIGMNENELSSYLFKTANSGYKYMKKENLYFLRLQSLV